MLRVGAFLFNLNFTVLKNFCHGKQVHYRLHATGDFNRATTS